MSSYWISCLRSAAGAFLAVGCAISLSLPAQAQLRITVDDGVREAVPLAIVSPNGPARELGREILSIVENNLARTGLIRIIPTSAHLERSVPIDQAPTFTNWRAIDSQALLVTSFEERGGQSRVSYRLWDTFSQRQTSGEVISFSSSEYRRAAHKLSDALYTALTGEGPYIDSRITFIDERGDKRARSKRLAIMDSDGENVSYLTGPREFVLTPKVSPDGRFLTYLSYRTGKPNAYIMDLETRRSDLLGSFRGMSFTPSFSPRGNTLALSMEENGNTDIYLMDFRGNVSRKLTSHPAIDTSPSFSPDARQIVFTSDRDGSPQLYVMNADGSGVRRITTGGSYSSPEWSPRGDFIAFSKLSRGQFSIGIIKPDGTGERILHTDYMLDSPTWAPNGRVLLFAKETRGSNSQSSLYTIDLTGTNLRRLPTPTSASDPSWSRLRD